MADLLGRIYQTVWENTIEEDECARSGNQYDLLLDEVVGDMHERIEKIFENHLSVRIPQKSLHARTIDITVNTARKVITDVL